MPLGIRVLSLELIGEMAKNPKGRGGTSRGRLDLMRLEHPATTLRRSGKKRDWPGGDKPPKGPKPVKIRAEQEDC